MVMAGTLFTFVVGFPFQIYLARSLGVAGLGLFGITEALVTTAAGLLSFGLSSLAVRFIPEYTTRGESRAIRRLVAFGLVILAATGALGASLLPLLAGLMPDIAGIPVEAKALLSVLALLLPVSMISFFLAQSLRGFQEIRIMVFSTSILALTLKVVLTFGLFATFGASVWSYAWAVVLAQATAIFPMAWALWRLMRMLPTEAEPSPVNPRAWASYAGTNYASGLLNMLIGNLDRVVVGALLGPSAVGVLMVVRQLQQFPTVFQQVVLTVVSPVFARMKASGNMAGLAHQLHLSNDWVMRMALGLILILAILPDHLLGLYGPTFASQGTSLMLVMALAAVVNLGTGPVGILLNMTGHHVVLLRVIAVTAVATFAGYFVLIPMFGLMGAGLAVLLGTIINNCVAIWLVWKRLGISWYNSRFSGWFLPSAAAGATLLAMRLMLNGVEDLGTRAALLASATFLTYAIFFTVNFVVGFHEDDRELMRTARSRIGRSFNRAKPLK